MRTVQKLPFATTDAFPATGFSGLGDAREKHNGQVLRFQIASRGNGKGEILSFCLTPGNTDGRDLKVMQQLTKNLLCKLFGDRGYISQSLFETLFDSGVHTVTGLGSNMKNRPMPL